LACFDQPSQVRQLVRENFGLDLSPQSIEHYDPYRYAGKELAKKFVCLFLDTRKRYLENVADVALAQKTHRLKWLERLAAEAERMGDVAGRVPRSCARMRSVTHLSRRASAARLSMPLTAADPTRRTA
jgi:hypothetical protein